MGYLLAAAMVFGVNLLPAFGPPTWALLVLFKLHFELAAIPLIAIGAASAASGRYLLARAAQRSGTRVFAKHDAALSAARDRITRHCGATLAGVGLFALSPIPSGQLFVAAGLLKLPLRALTVSFFAGRVVSYSGYVTAATVADRTYGGVALSVLRSPIAAVVQLLLLLALALLPMLLSRSMSSRARQAEIVARLENETQRRPQ